MTDMQTEHEKVQDVGNLHQYICSVSPHLFKRISKHVNLSKALDNLMMTKRSWILEAIKEKLEKDNDYQSIPKDTRISFHIDKPTWKLIQERVDHIRKFRRTTYSKKQWLVEAIEEKLSIEEDAMRKKLEKAHSR